jgi:uncharacterized protein (TIGR00255 family)
LAALQGRVAELVRVGVRRGRVDVTVSVQANRRDRRRVAFDAELLQRYHDALTALKTRFRLKDNISLTHLLALPQALTIIEDHAPSEQLAESIARTTQAAVQQLVQTRRREGAKLLADLRRQLRLIHRYAQAVKRRLPKALVEQRRELRQRLRGLLGSGNGHSVSRLEEVVALVKETDIHEELVRIDSHLSHVAQVLTSGQPIGKQLDFIAQELVRETNTMGAKVRDHEAARHVVEIKSCIERIREQVQNLE